jgi:hypothetical protein
MDTSGKADPAETARYIEQMTRELRGLASTSNLGFLAFLLRMVEDDAGAEASKRDPKPAS